MKRRPLFFHDPRVLDLDLLLGGSDADEQLPLLLVAMERYGWSDREDEYMFVHLKDDTGFDEVVHHYGWTLEMTVDFGEIVLSTYRKRKARAEALDRLIARELVATTEKEPYVPHPFD